jgi:hypothetical protein
MPLKLIKKLVCLLFISGGIYNASAQVSQKIGTNPFNKNSSAVLELESTTKGFLPPRMTTVQRDAIVSPAKGLILYNTDTNLLEMNAGTTIAPVWIVTTGAAAAPLWTVGNYVANALVTHTDGQVYRANSNMTSGVTSFNIGTVANEWTVVASSAIAPNWEASKYYPKNQLVRFSDGFMYRANEIIPTSQSTFLTGTSGATWSPVNISSAPLWTARYYPKNALVTHTDGFLYKANSEMLPTVTSFIVGATENQWTLIRELSNTLSSGKVFLGDANNVTTAVSVTGDVTISNTGVATIGANKVTTSKILDGSVNTDDIANNAVTSAKILDRNVGTIDIADNAITSTEIADNAVVTTKMANNAVSLYKFVQKGAKTLVGRDEADSGNVESLTVNQALSMLGISNPNSGGDGYIDILDTRIVWGKSTSTTAGTRTVNMVAGFNSYLDYCVVANVVAAIGDLGVGLVQITRRNSGTSFDAYVCNDYGTSSSKDFFYIAIGTK